MPSTDELNKLADNRFEVNKALSGISGATPIRHFRNGTTDFDYLWSSSESDANNAWFNYTGALNGGKYYYDSKPSNNQVRAIRAFSVPSNPVTDVDGNTYETVTIGTQVWMKENLKVSKYRNGDAIQTLPTNWSNTTTGAYVIYNNDNFNNGIYGKLYNWFAVTDPRDVCPVGFHVPSDAEWSTLENNLGGSSFVGGHLKSTGSPQEGTGLWNFPNTGATNSSGFKGLPGGLRDNNGLGPNYFGAGNNGFWWSKTEFSSANSLYRQLTYNDSVFSRTNGDKNVGLSVRCLKD